MTFLLKVVAAAALFGGNWCLSAQQYLISTYAGGSPPPTPASAVTASIGYPEGVTTDGSSNLYFTSQNCIFKLDKSGVMTRIAGTGRSHYSGDGGPATAAEFEGIGSIAVDTAGNLYVTDLLRVRKISTSGIITTVAGNGSFGQRTLNSPPIGDGGPATNASFYSLDGLTVDKGGNLYIADADGYVVRRVTPDRIISTVAGTGVVGFSGDGGPASTALLNLPFDVAVDAVGNLFIVDYLNDRIRKVDTHGIISTVVGNGSIGFSGDGGPATSAALFGPEGMSIDGTGNLYFSDVGNYRIRKVSNSGIITTIAGNGAFGYSGDSGPATNATLGENTSSVAADASGNVYIAELRNSRVRKISSDGILTTVAGNGTPGYSGDGGPALAAQISSPQGITVDAGGNIYFTDTSVNKIRKIASNGTITTFAGVGVPGYAGDGGAAQNAELFGPTGLALDAAGNLYVADRGNNVIRKISPAGIIMTVAGNGSAGFSGDGGPATKAQLQEPMGVTVAKDGTIYIADTSNFRIRKVSPAGTIATIAGIGPSDLSLKDGSAAISAAVFPVDITLDASGNVVFADSFFSIVEIKGDGTISTIAGGGSLGVADGQAAEVSISPSRVAFDATGALWFVSQGQLKRIRNGFVQTIACANGYYFGDGGPAANAGCSASDVVIGTGGNVYFSDNNGAIRLLRPTNQAVILSSVLDAASESATPISPGKIVVIYGGGLGPMTLVQNQPVNGAFGSQVGGTSVSFSGIAAPMVYSSATQVAAIAPYEISGSPTVQVAVTSLNGLSSPFTVPVAPSAPSFFSSNGTGAGQIAAVNVDGSLNDAAHPVKIGGYVSLYATGEGATSPAGVDGKLALSQPYPRPLLPVKVTVGGVPAMLTYAGAAPTEVAGLMQIVIQIPMGVQPGGYVPVVLQVGNNSTIDGAAWIAVSGN